MTFIFCSWVGQLSTRLVQFHAILKAFIAFGRVFAKLFLFWANTRFWPNVWMTLRQTQMFGSCFVNKKTNGWGHYHGGKARLGYHLVLGPLFCKWPHLGAKLAHKTLYQSSECVTLCECKLVDLHAHLNKKINMCKIKGVVCNFFCKNIRAKIQQNISLIKTTIQKQMLWITIHTTKWWIFH
jgi:hypothetical protein